MGNPPGGGEGNLQKINFDARIQREREIRRVKKL